MAWQFWPRPKPSDRLNDVFISYSHAESGEVAAGLQSWLQRYAKPWWRRRAIKVFRDQTDLGASPELWNTIVRELDRSAWLVVIASPEAARSKWVKRELRYWLGDTDAVRRPLQELDEPIPRPNHTRRKRVLVVLAAGNMIWRDGSGDLPGDLDWQHTDALPRCLAGVFTLEPYWVDLRRTVDTPAERRSLDRSNPRFMDAVARLSVPIRGLELAELIGEDSRLHRRAIRTAYVTGLALLFLAIAALAGLWMATIGGQTADWQRQIATAERAAADARARAAINLADLPQAAMAGRGAYLQLHDLARSSPMPDWVRRLVQLLSRVGFDVFDLVDRVGDYRLTPESVASADEVMRLADDLVPSLVKSLPATEAQAVSDAALLDDSGSITYVANNVFYVWRHGETRPQPLAVAVPLSRENGQDNRAISHNGGVIAVEADDHVVRVYTTANGRMAIRIDPRAVFSALAFDQPPPVQPTDGAPRREVIRNTPSTAAPLLAGLALDADGDRLALVSRGGRVRLLALDLDGASARPVGVEWTATVPGTDDIMRMSSWVLDLAGARLATTPSSFPIGRVPVMVWRGEDGSVVSRLMHEGGVGAMVFADDGRVATGLDNGNIYIWDSSGVRERSLNLGLPVQSVAFGRAAADGLLLAGAEQVVRVFDLSTGREIARAPQAGRVDTVNWTSDGRHFMTAGVLTDGRSPLRLWKLDGAQRVAPLRMRPRHEIARLALHGGLLAAIGWPSDLYLWDTASGDTKRTVLEHIIRSAVAIDSRAGKVVTVASEDDGLAVVFDIASGERRVIPGRGLTTVAYADRRPFIRGAAFDARGRRLFRLVHQMGDPLCLAEVWDLETAKGVLTAPCSKEGHHPVITSAGDRIAWLEGDDIVVVRVRSVHDEHDTWTYSLGAREKSNAGVHLAFSANGQRLIAASGAVVRVFEAANGVLVDCCGEADGTVLHVALNGAGDIAAVATETRRLSVIDVSTRQVTAIHAFETDSIGGGGIVVSDDEQMIYAAFGDSNANHPRVWRWRLGLNALADAVNKRLQPALALDTPRK